jgi:Protein of unknown function (DUF1214)
MRIKRRTMLGMAAGLASPGIVPAALSGPLAAGSRGLQPVIDYLTKAQSIAADLGYDAPELQPSLQRQILLLLSLGYVEVFGTSIESPNWVPHIPFYLPWGSPNPDDNYYFVPLDPGGRYRIYGRQGTAPITTVTLRTGGAHLGQINGRTLLEIDLHEVPADRRGHYEFHLGSAPTAGPQGRWYPIPPQTTSLLFRSRTFDGRQADAECHIERLDSVAAPAFLDAAVADHKIDMLCTYAARQLEFLLGYLNGVRRRGGGDGFIFDDQSGYGGLVKQRYLMHVFKLAADEVLILESELPEKFTYFSVQLYDAFFAGIDNVGRRSALNHTQMRPDPDGRLRIVVAGQDPGAANWLDTGGWPQAGLMWRWNDANRFPVPSVRRVRIQDLRTELPASTRWLDAGQRRQQLAAHARYTRRRGR